MNACYVFFLSQWAVIITDWIFSCYIECLQWKGKRIVFSLLWSHNWKEAKSRLTYTYCLQKKYWKLNHLKCFKENFFLFSCQELRFVLITKSTLLCWVRGQNHWNLCMICCTFSFCYQEKTSKPIKNIYKWCQKVISFSFCLSKHLLSLFLFQW